MTHAEEQQLAAWQAKINAPASERKTRTQAAEPSAITAPTSNPIYNAYWKFAAERQSVFYKRMRGEPGPWSQDPIIQQYTFTNAYRASDRASQFLIRNVIYDGHENQRGPEDTFFRVLLFKIVNLPETWEYLQGKADLTWTGDKATSTPWITC